MITRDSLKFRPSADGVTAAIPGTSDKVTDFHSRRAQFAWYADELRFQRYGADGKIIATGATLRDVVPELMDDSCMSDLVAAGKRFGKIRAQLDEASTLLYACIVAAHEAGASESAIARAAGVDRMTVRRALGKR